MSTIIRARQALTDSGWRRDLTVCIGPDGRIGEITEEPLPADIEVGVLLPALANVHSHSFQRAMAGLAERRGTSERDDFWSWRKVMYHFLEVLTPEAVEVVAAQVQMEMLEAGYAACAEFHYLHHDRDGKRYKQPEELSLRHVQSAQVTGIGLTLLPVLYMRGAMDGRALSGGQQRFGCELDEFQQLHENLARHFVKLPSDYVLGVAPHSLRAVPRCGLDLALELAGGGPIHLHAAEQVGEVSEVRAALGATPIRWLLDNLPVDARWCLIHATHMDAEEVGQLAQSGAVAGLCPSTEANLGDGIFPGSDYLAAGGDFGVGSDSNVRISLTEELRLLELSQRLRDQRRVVLSNEHQPSNGRLLLEQAARGGAKATGRTSGIIQTGFLADLVALDDTSHWLAGLSGDTLLDTWIFASGDNLVTDVWSAGRHVVAHGCHQQREAIASAFLQTITDLRKTL